MPDVYDALALLSAARRQDPLAPVTVIAPSHASALQLRRRLAESGPFAAVRFEPLPRVAELLGAGELALAGRSPLARPIGDYVAERVALESRGSLADVRDLPGYARVLRQIFRRLRRGGIRTSLDVHGARPAGHFPEMLRLYDLYRQQTSAFYDEEDLLDAAADAVLAGRAGVMADLGAIYIVPPGPLSAAGTRLLSALRERAPHVAELEEPAAAPQQRFTLAPDPASEAREAAREVLSALEAGTPLGEIAVFHGAADNYPKLLREAFDAAGITAVPLPGIPLIETLAGRALMGLARLPEKDYSRNAVIDLLSVAPIRDFLPDGNTGTRALTTVWDRISREAGITHGAATWSRRLGHLVADNEADIAKLDPIEYESRIAVMARQMEQANTLTAVIEELIARIEPLRQMQSAAQFIAGFRALAEAYLRPDAESLTEVLEEIDQLGTIGAVDGSFSLESFAEALDANLRASHRRPERLGNGVVIAEYRAAAGLRFQHVVLCGAYEGAFPAGPGADALLDDGAWRALKLEHPHIEDAETRITRAREAVQRATGAAGNGQLAWFAPMYEPGGTREYYPSPAFVAAVGSTGGRAVTASDLRRASLVGLPVTRGSSPLAVMLRGPVLEPGEALLRRAVSLKQDGRAPDPAHARARALSLLSARRGSAFTEWDGNLSELDEASWLDLQRAVSPTSLENYAVCGFRYLCRSLLKLNTVDEPGDREVMDSATRGTLIHDVLERFFRERAAAGRPTVNEAWTEDDLRDLLSMTDEALEEARQRGQTGLHIYAQHEARTMKADLTLFLEEDTQFRRETGAVPYAFEAAIPETDIAGVRMRGRVDRIDRTPDGRRAWVIDYKTGRSYGMKTMESDPLQGGTKLQLPTYIAAADAEEIVALYWFISQKGEFLKVAYPSSGEGDRRFEATVQAIVEGIRGGAFPAVPREEDEYYGGFENCRFCDFNRICSRRRDIEYATKQDDPGMEPWRLVEVASRPEGVP